MEQSNAHTVVVTGSSGGLGSAIVKILRDSGRRVIGIDRSISTDVGFEHTLEGDVSGEQVWMALQQLLSNESITLRALINCAGGSTRSNISDTTLDDWQSVLSTNLTSTWLGMKSCLPHLCRDGGGSIVNVGSMYGRLPPPGPPNPPTSPAYQAAKAGIVALTRTGASEFAQYGIRVNCVEPGLFSTPLTNDLPSELFKIRMRNVALKRSGEPSELANVIKFLISEDASYVTGVTIGVDGGYPLCL